MRKRFVLGATATALALMGGVAAAQSFGDSAETQPAGPVHACVESDGTLAWFQWREGADPNCYDGDGGITRWSWNQTGEPGADGNDGVNGTDGISGYEVLNTEERVSTGSGVVAISCPDGKFATGGGFEFSAVRGEGGVQIMASQPTTPVEQEDGTWRSTGWEVKYTVLADQANVKPTVHCATVN